MSMSDITAETMARLLFENWITRFGAPARITTDQGQQFESELFKQLARLTGSQHIRTTAYHPAANGMIERLYRQLKAYQKPRNRSMDTNPSSHFIRHLRRSKRGHRSHTSRASFRGDHSDSRAILGPNQ
nr:PREDICTED: uncharacterized protein LOC105679285 [Linepithema humile]